MRLQLEPQHAVRAAEIRSGRVVLSLGAAKSLQGQAYPINLLASKGEAFG